MNLIKKGGLWSKKKKRTMKIKRQNKCFAILAHVKDADDKHTHGASGEASLSRRSYVTFISDAHHFDGWRDLTPTFSSSPLPGGDPRLPIRLSDVFEEEGFPPNSSAGIYSRHSCMCTKVPLVRAKPLKYATRRMRYCACIIELRVKYTETDADVKECNKKYRKRERERWPGFFNSIFSAPLSSNVIIPIKAWGGEISWRS